MRNTVDLLIILAVTAQLPPATRVELGLIDARVRLGSGVAVRKAFQDEGIPLTVLIDAQGKIVHYATASAINP